MNYLNNFLESEINNQEMYEDILNFIFSSNIRKGEYECNIHVIKKMDQVNYIIYEEYTNRDETEREIQYSFSMFRNDLVKEINKFAKSKGLDISKYKNFDKDYSLEKYCNYKGMV